MRYTPRPYQLEFLNAMEKEGKRFATLVWHRRAGKDLTALALLVKRALKEVGIYYYVFPSLKQARKIIWDGKTGKETNGIKFLDLMIDKRWLWPNPDKGTNDTEMKIRLRHPDNPNKEGSIIQLVGTKGDEADSIVGTGPIGFLFSEYSLQSPIVWEVMSPIIAENGGWAVFVYTPRGHNHGEDLFKNAEKHPDWYTSILTVEDTKRNNGQPVITQETIEDERQMGKREEFIQREYYCSFEGAADGAVYGEEFQFAYDDNRVVEGLYDPTLEVTTAWDIGRDMTAVGFFQQKDNLTYVIDYIQHPNKSLDYFARLLNTKAIQMGYRYSGHVFPHDLKVHEYSTGQSRYRHAVSLGLTPINMAPKLDLDSGIDAVRRQFKFMEFDKTKCAKLLHSISSYVSESDDETMEIMANRVGPKWATHGCDMLRTYFTAPKMLPTNKINNLPKEVRNDYDPFTTGGDPRESWGDTRPAGRPIQDSIPETGFPDLSQKDDYFSVSG